MKRIQVKEDGSLTATCQVGDHAECINIIPMPNGGTQGVAQHFLKYHTDLNQGSKGSGQREKKNPWLLREMSENRFPDVRGREEG